MSIRAEHWVIGCLLWLVVALVVSAGLSQHQADLEHQRDDLAAIKTHYEETRSRLEDDIKAVTALSADMRNSMQDAAKKSAELQQALQSIEQRLQGSESLREEVVKLRSAFSELDREVGELEDAHRARTK